MADNEEDLVDYDEEEEEQNVAAEEAADAEGKEVKKKPMIWVDENLGVPPLHWAWGASFIRGSRPLSQVMKPKARAV
eukprot:scaffold3304_cov126-Skeletonema_marinoi.AAC.3